MLTASNSETILRQTEMPHFYSRKVKLEVSRKYLLDYKKSQFPRVEAVMILSAFDVKIRELPLYVMPLRIYFFRLSIFLHKDTML